MNITPNFITKGLTPADVDIIFELLSKNKLFYKYHPPFVTRESILEDMNALPPGKSFKDKFYMGFFEGNRLVAVMDLVLDYPEEKTAFIGFFMVEQDCQGKEIGSRIIRDCTGYLADNGYRKIRLAIDKGNPQSEHFWTKNGFVKTGEDCPNDFSAYLPMEKYII